MLAAPVAGCANANAEPGVTLGLGPGLGMACHLGTASAALLLLAGALELVAASQVAALPRGRICRSQLELLQPLSPLRLWLAALRLWLRLRLGLWLPLWL